MAYVRVSLNDGAFLNDDNLNLLLQRGITELIPLDEPHDEHDSANNEWTGPQQ